MGLVYVGDTSFLETESSGSQTVDLWGFDVLTREYEGSKALLSTFLASFKLTIAGFSGSGIRIVLDRSRQIQDAVLKSMYMTEIAISNSRAFSKVTCTFKGVANGREPKETVRFGQRAQQVTLPFIGDELGVTNGISASFVYNAPFATYTYISKRKPTGAKFKSNIEPVKDAIQIQSRTGAAGDIAFFRGRSITNRTANVSSVSPVGTLNHYNAIIECINESFDAEPVGQWWQVTEVNQIVLTPLDLAQSGWIYQLSD